MPLQRAQRHKIAYAWHKTFALLTYNGRYVTPGKIKGRNLLQPITRENSNVIHSNLPEMVQRMVCRFNSTLNIAFGRGSSTCLQAQSRLSFHPLDTSTAVITIHKNVPPSFISYFSTQLDSEKNVMYVLLKTALHCTMDQYLLKR